MIDTKINVYAKENIKGTHYKLNEKSFRKYINILYIGKRIFF